MLNISQPGYSYVNSLINAHISNLDETLVDSSYTHNDNDTVTFNMRVKAFDKDTKKYTNEIVNSVLTHNVSNIERLMISNGVDMTKYYVIPYFWCETEFVEMLLRTNHKALDALINYLNLTSSNNGMYKLDELCVQRKCKDLSVLKEHYSQ